MNTSNTPPACKVSLGCKATPDTPYCHPQAEKCVACLENAHCTEGAARFCSIDEWDAKCVECYTDEDCTKGPDNTGRCYRNQCNGCDEIEECEEVFTGDILGCEP